MYNEDYNEIETLLMINGFTEARKKKKLWIKITTTKRIFIDLRNIPYKTYGQYISSDSNVDESELVEEQKLINQIYKIEKIMRNQIVSNVSKEDETQKKLGDF